MVDSGRDLATSKTGRSFQKLSLWRSDTFRLERTDTMVKFGKLKFRGQSDDLPQNWWVASTAFPLLAATIGPLANVLSIAALVTKWRVELPDNGQLPAGKDDAGVDIPDPRWEIILNAISLACGVLGNFALLLNFTKRVRYIIALPVSIISWFFATAILTGIIIAMNQYDAPIRPGQTYSQGFWHAIIAAVLYMIGSIILMVNMLGYFLGHYPQHFELDDDQRTLILQSMMFFIWLAGGAGIFTRLCGFTYANSLYFCDVTILTVGFGDIVPTNDRGRGFLIPYSLFGIIFLGLMINSIRKFAVGMSKDKIIKQHQQNKRAQTASRSVTSEKELRQRLGLPARKESDVRRDHGTRKLSNSSAIAARRASLEQYGHFNVQGRTITFHEHKAKGGGSRGGAGRNRTPSSPDAQIASRTEKNDQENKRGDRTAKLVLLREEKDRFDAMREIQSETSRFKQYSGLLLSLLAFGILWCIGAVVFWIAEARIQKLTYFEALYFCWVSLLTIGYGDFSPESNAGKPFFVVWSLVAIPTMTILVSDLGDTVVSAINKGTFRLADYTVLPKAGIWRDFLEKYPKLGFWLERRIKEREAKKRVDVGFSLQDPDEEVAAEGADENRVLGGSEDPTTIEKLAEESPETTEHDLARRLAVAIKRTAKDLRAKHAKKYSYEEWVEFTRLIRFSSETSQQAEKEEDEEGLVEWDWIGEDSPMLADVTESEWILDRLCESLNRYTRRQAREAKTARRHGHRLKSNETDADAITPYCSINDNTHSSNQRSTLYPAHPGPRNSHAYQKAHRGDFAGPSTESHSEYLQSHPVQTNSNESSNSESEDDDDDDDEEEEEENLRKQRAVIITDDDGRDITTSRSEESGEASGGSDTVVGSTNGNEPTDPTFSSREDRNGRKGETIS